MGAAFLYALSPRVLSTLTTISSETWPVMLAPWVLWPLITRRLTLRSIAMSVLAIGMMGGGECHRHPGRLHPGRHFPPVAAHGGIPVATHRTHHDVGPGGSAD